MAAYIPIVALAIAVLTFVATQLSLQQRAKHEELEALRKTQNGETDELRRRLTELERHNEECERDRITLRRENLELMRQIVGLDPGARPAA